MHGKGVCFLTLLLAHSHYGSHKHWASCNGGYVGRKLVITHYSIALSLRRQYLFYIRVHPSKSIGHH